MSLKTSRTKAVLIAAALAGAIVAGTTATTTAFDRHFIDCVGWMIVDPDSHAANCLPGRAVAPDGSISPTSGGSSITTTTTVTTILFTDG